ncbi:orotidine-5'-phosphate decarboxylase [Alphaproteobacteria bacterium]|nr:orotidine-5'-phosphate decarboxylase [Alphaproteobacteria bacterium]
MIKQNKIIIALDTNNLHKAISVAAVINENIILKIGMEFFYTFGYEGINKIKNLKKNIKIFLDLKLHDIPNTVSKAIVPLIENINPYMLTLHATGGKEMLNQVVQVVRKKPKKIRPILLGVTVLTSLDSKSLQQLGWNPDINDNVINYALMCKNAGLDGVICSALEIECVRKACGEKFLIVTPGIRLEKKSKNDQARVLTPKAAFEKGTNYIVLGRPIMNSKNPEKEILTILNSI